MQKYFFKYIRKIYIKIYSLSIYIKNEFTSNFWNFQDYTILFVLLQLCNYYNYKLIKL